MMRVAVKNRKRQKQSKIIALHLKSALAKPATYDGEYTGKLETASPDNPVGVMKPSLFLLFDKRSLEGSTCLKTAIFNNFWQQRHEKSSLGVETRIRTH